MLTVKVDPHTHTIFSGHAYSTIEENAIHAAERGMEGIAVTDHFSPLFSKTENLFKDFGPILNMSALPKVIHGVRVLSGAEIDIVDFDGNLAGYDTKMTHKPDMTVSEALLSGIEVSIASVHGFEGYKDGSVIQNTQMYVNVIHNYKVNIIGHMDRGGMVFDIKEILKAAKEEGTMIEINEHSFDFDEQTIKTCTQLAIGCAEEGVPVVVSSDAHSAFFIGQFDRALKMLEEIDFPKELIANETLEKFVRLIKKKKESMS